MFEAKDEDAGRYLQIASLLRKLLDSPLGAGEIEASRRAIDSARGEDVAMSIDLLIQEGVPIRDLDPAVSKLVNLLGASLSRQDFLPDDPFFESLTAENRGIRAALDAIRPFLGTVNRAAALPDAEAARASLRAGVEALGPIDLHYVKKENILFPVFEKRYPRWRCVTLMWSLHDSVRRELKSLGEVLGASEAPDLAELNASFGRLFFAAHAILFREERILFPLAAALLEKEERFGLYRESKNLGFAFLDRAEISLFEEQAASESFLHALPPMPAGAGVGGAASKALPLDAGALPLPVLDAILKSTPVDLTFVDARDRVAWFTNGPHRIFPRSPAIIGRDVRNCHPADSVGRVLDLIESFRSGLRDSEDFWIDHRGRFIHIRYVAVRDAAGAYLGTLESSQDITELRALAGEKRLADRLQAPPSP